MREYRHDARSKHREIIRPREVWMRVRYIGPGTETMRYLEVEFDMAGKATRLLVRPDDLLVTEPRG